MTAPHIGNTGVNDEDAESRADLGRRLRRPRPGPAALELARRGASLDEELRRRRASSASAASTPARSPGTCASAARCGPASSPGAAPTPGRGSCWTPSARPRRWPARTWPARSRTVEPYVVPAIGGASGFTVAARRPRHQGDDAAPDGRARHRGARAARDGDRSTDSWRPQPDGVFFSNGPGDPADRRRRGRAAARGAARRRPVLRHLLRQPDPRPGARASAPTSCGYGHRGINQPVLDRATGKVEVTAHNHGFAVDAPAGRAVADDRLRPRRGQPRLPQRRRRRGPALPRRRRLLACSTTPRPRPARTTPATSSTASST